MKMFVSYFAKKMTAQVFLQIWQDFIQLYGNFVDEIKIKTVFEQYVLFVSKNVGFSTGWAESKGYC